MTMNEATRWRKPVTDKGLRDYRKRLPVALRNLEKSGHIIIEAHEPPSDMPLRIVAVLEVRIKKPW